MLRRKLLTGWESLDFLKDFWNPVWDERDLLQYRRLAEAWRLHDNGMQYTDIDKKLRWTYGTARALVSGFNRHPYLAQMYLNHEMVRAPRDGWKWILQTTPKPTVPYPQAVQVPEQIMQYQDITDFLKQFPPLRDDDPQIKFFGLRSEWVQAHKAELFGFILAFLVGDAGKDYPEYEYRSRHYNKTAMTTNMEWKPSNFRVLRYVALAMRSIGIQSYRVKSSNGVVRWNSDPSNIITWIVRVCIGLKEGERTSYNPVRIPWLANCPKEFIVAFLQGIADSDGYVADNGNYAELCTIPNVLLYKKLLRTLSIKGNLCPRDNPKSVRMTLPNAVRIPLFCPTVKSYRYQQLMRHARRRRILPPPPSSFFLRLLAQFGSHAFCNLQRADYILPSNPVS